jgi:hypothetical protein
LDQTSALVFEDPPETEGFLLPERGAGSVYERMRPSKIIAFDCDSTLSGIEGIDEMARLRGAACFAEIDAMTRDAMEGRISLDSIFARRLDIVRANAGGKRPHRSALHQTC